MGADDVAVEYGHLQFYADHAFVDVVRPNPRAEKGRVEIDHAFAETLPAGAHRLVYVKLTRSSQFCPAFYYSKPPCKQVVPAQALYNEFQ